MFRDCQSGEAPFDDNINLFIFESANPSSYDIISIPKPASTPEIVPEDWDNCVGVPYSLCVEVGVYTTLVTLPPIAGGYDIGWARCCRNGTIVNLFSPLDQGVTFSVHVPGPEDAVCNSSAVWKNSLPVFICANETFVFDHSATDADGDSLVYILSNPNNGLNFMGMGASNGMGGNKPPSVGSTNPMGPPPYQTVTYNGASYNPTNPFGPGTASIDPVSGYLTFTPTSIGVYVVAISVLEYRSGILISENKKDFQIHVIPCKPMGDPPAISHDLSGLTTSGDTIFADANRPFCYSATVTDPNPGDDLVANGISGLFSSGNPFPPNATILSSGTNPLTLDICWQPSCEYIGDTVNLVIAARDPDDCLYHNEVFDTVYVIIQPTPPNDPRVGHDLSMVPSSGDTIILEVDSIACFNWWVVDTTGGTDIEHDFRVEELSGAASYDMTATVSDFGDSLSIVSCWTANCEQRDKLFRVILAGTDQATCPPFNQGFDTLYVRVLNTPNPSPVLYHDLSGNVLVGDTIQIDVHQEACYTFVLNDTFPAVGLTYNISVEGLSGGSVGGPPPAISILSTVDSIVGRVCWTPNCDNVNGLFRLILEGIQENQCDSTRNTFDTTYIRVNDVLNPPPVIGHTFLPGYNLKGDTIVVAADSAACFSFSLEDTAASTLFFLDFNFEVISLVTGDSLSDRTTVNFTTFTDNLIKGEICITPGCEYLGDLLKVTMVGRDTFDCHLSNWVYDSVFIQVDEPFNQPPAITHFLGGLETIDGVVQVEAGTRTCYDLILEDPDSIYASLIASGNSGVFLNTFGNGNPAEISVSGDNPLNIQVCWQPSCYEEKETYSLVVCGRDTSRCDILPDVCDTVQFYIKPCSITVQNVFTPNNDGINDEFLPFDLSGVESYTMWIFDRWGVEMVMLSNMGWNGNNAHGKPAQSGVYYYLVEYKYFSAEGEPLGDTVRGSVMLVR